MRAKFPGQIAHRATCQIISRLRTSDRIVDDPHDRRFSVALIADVRVYIRYSQYPIQESLVPIAISGLELGSGFDLFEANFRNKLCLERIPASTVRRRDAVKDLFDLSAVLEQLFSRSFSNVDSRLRRRYEVPSVETARFVVAHNFLCPYPSTFAIMCEVY
jgi:hypothetical protein